ncbi:FHA domain-containing protein [Leifsonia sp. 2MCAF36]|uniref:FHA domain-containing protein n=1 Tax=Leifsonia sp. 2MCAF36 TaxID=3232988 RepID=UPI003F9D31FC
MFEVQQAAAGEWAVVAGGGRALLVVEPDAGRLRTLLPAVRAGFAETLDALVAGGLSRTPSFALLDASTDAVLLAVRGTASAVVTESGRERTVRATGVSSWVETQLTDAEAVSIGDGTSEGALPLVEGVVRATGLGWAAAERPEDVAATVAAPPKRERDTGPVYAVVEEPAQPDLQTRVPEATLGGVSAESESASEDADESATPETAGYDHLFGATMVRSVEEAAVRPEDEEAAPARIDLPGFITDSFPPAAGRLEGDHDGLTVMSGDLPRRSPAAEAAETPEPVPAREEFAVLLSDGRREPLSVPIVVGRAPSVTAVPSLHGARPVTLTSAEDDISRSHVAVVVEGDSVVVTDLHSRNGTLVVLPGASPQKLRSGEPTTVVIGTVIDLGSGATLTVEAAG